MLNSVSFTAKYLQTKTIKTRSDNNTFQDKKAKFVELDPDCPNDIDAIRQTNRNWSYTGYTFLDNISEEFQDCREFENPSSFKRFFALTTQKSKLGTLRPEKILGVAEVIVTRAPDNITLKYLQADPNNNMHCKNSQYKKVGSNVIDGLKEEFKKADIIVEPVDDEATKKFYEANGFQPYGSKYMIYRHQT